jgi:hypothetical protein
MVERRTSVTVVEGLLKHYGVKGMQWGVRKRRKTPREPAHGDAKRSKKVVGRARESGTDAISNQDLRRAIERMNLEQQYNRLRPKSNSEKAKAWVAETLLGIGKEQASRVARDAAAEQVGNLLKKAR